MNGSASLVSPGESHAASADVAMSISHMSKAFGAVRALQDVTLDLRSASILALLGENGAGKSTLVAAASGALVPDSGTILASGRPVRFTSPRDGIRAGVQVVHQEPKLVNEYSIAENIFLGEAGALRAVRSRGMGSLSERADGLLSDLGLKTELPDVRRQAARLTAAERQIVAIAKAMAGAPRILFLDEPNSSLTSAETERLWSVARELRAKGVSLVIVSHRLTELYEVVDRVAVLRDGRLVGTGSPAEVPIGKALSLMAGAQRARPQAATEPAVPPVPAALRTAGTAPVLSVRQLRTRYMGPATFEVGAGEVVGLAGLVGAGRTEIGRALSGADPVRSGLLLLDGKPIRFRSPRAAMRAGVVMTCEERKRVVFRSQNVQENIAASILDQTSRLGFARRAAQRQLADEWISRLAIRGSADSPVISLSGGNQQKVLIARALATRPRVLILDEPTHGVDVATRAEIYQLIRQLARRGLAVLLISSDTEELVEQSDRIVVVRNGRTVDELAAGSGTFAVVSAALGQNLDSALQEQAHGERDVRPSATGSGGNSA
jgi:ABC-type sugar transport system ATPase subunit